MSTSEIVKDFRWELVVAVHEIGPYAIIEYHPHKMINGSWTPRNGNDMDRVEFHDYVNGKDTSHSHDSLDAALAHAIAYRAEGCNSHAGEYFMRMIATGAEKGGKG
jgi:hypothetical protein